MSRAPRADARRNREQLLAAAHAAFTEAGTEASLEDVARRAGVGIGTLYRHFPTRHDLVDALLQERFAQLRQAAETELTGDDPLAALLSWLRLFIERTRTYRGLPSSVHSAMRDRDSALYESCHRMQDAGLRLVLRAQDAGTLRADVDPLDVLALAGGIAWLDEQDHGDAERPGRLLDITVDGLRVRNTTGR